MGNVLRVLGIVVASMLLGLVGLFLGLFTICGGLKSTDGSSVLAICLALVAGAVAVIVILGRGLAARASTRGLAVAPAGAPPAGPQADASQAGALPEIARPAVQSRPLSGTDRQVLMGLRVALGLHILLSVGSMAVNVVDLSRYDISVAIQLILRNVLTVLPPAIVLVAVSLRTPPPGAALAAAAGMGIASLLFRFGFVAFSGMLTSTLSQVTDMAFLLLRMGAFSALEAGVAGLALHLRSRLGPSTAGAVIVAVLAFLAWDGLVQVAMQILMNLVY